jgi:CO/xanthine dehydrogenase FAD-binding subunit
VGVTAFGYPDSSAPSGYRFRIVLASVAPIPLVVTTAQDYLASNPISSEAFNQAARLAQDACTPIDDVRGSARYRRAMVYNLTKKALEKVWRTIENGEP